MWCQGTVIKVYTHMWLQPFANATGLKELESCTTMILYYCTMCTCYCKIVVKWYIWTVYMLHCFSKRLVTLQYVTCRQICQLTSISTRFIASDFHFLPHNPSLTWRIRQFQSFLITLYKSIQIYLTFTVKIAHLWIKINL